MDRRYFLASSGGSLLLCSPSSWSTEPALTAVYGVPDAGVTMRLTFQPPNVFYGVINPGPPSSTTNMHFQSNPTDSDNSYVKVALDSHKDSYVLIRVLFRARNNGTVLSDAGDVNTAYKAPSSQNKPETDWSYVGNIIREGKPGS